MERFTEIVTDSKGRKAKIEYTAESRWPLTDAPCEWPRRDYIYYVTPPTCKSTNDPDFSLTEWFVNRHCGPISNRSSRKRVSRTTKRERSFAEPASGSTVCNPSS